MQTSISDRLADKLAERLGKDLPYRGDLYVVDHKALSKASTTLLLGFKPHLGNPSSKDVQDFVFSTFDQKMIPHMDTARVYSNDGAVTVIASMYVPTRLFKDSKNMMSIASTLFMDQNLNETWEVKSNEAGKFLSRIVEEDVDTIVSKRRQTMNSKSCHVSFASIGASQPYIGKGAMVRVFDDNIVIRGKVTDVSPKTVTVKAVDSGKLHKVPLSSVIEVLEMSPADKNKFLKEVQEFYGRVYSPEFSKEMADNA